jgi:hypothetical protein
MESRFRLYQFQTNQLQGELDGQGWRCHAGYWCVQLINDQGQWRNYDGPYAPHEKSTAEARLKLFQDDESQEAKP